MSDVMSVRSTCEMALRKIGAYTKFQTGANAEELAIAADFLDALVRHDTSVHPSQILVPDELTFPTEANKSKYLLAQTLGLNYPPEGVFFPIHATVTERGQTFRSQTFDLKIQTRQVWDDIENKETTGRPLWAYIDRLEEPTAWLWPVPPSDRYTVNLRVQRFASDLRLGGNLPAVADSKIIQLRQTWKLYLVTGLAAQIGDGPVRALRDHQIRRFINEADRLRMELREFEDREHADEGRVIMWRDPGK